MDDIVLCTHHGAIAEVTLNRPDAGNSLSMAMLERLSGMLAELESGSHTKVIVISARGRIFCAGHDLKELTAARSQPDRGQAFFSKTMDACAQLMQQIVNHKLPVIASVQGIATAAGCQLVASCDLAVAGRAAQFATPGVHIGLFCSTPMVALSRNIAPKHAMEMLLTGDMVSAEQAQIWGLVNHAVDDAALADETLSLAQKIASKPASTVAIGKTAFYRQAELSLQDAYSYAAEVMVHNMMSKDAEEGISAFIEKREARWNS
jgi:enoyl-CoA hydratase/carnithine racemase